MQSRVFWISAVFLGVSANAHAGDAGKKPNYEDDVVPVLRNHCLGCHNATKARADLDLSTFGGVMNGSSGGQVVNPGDSAGSKLFLVTAHQAEPKMPPKSARIPDAELAILKAWIDGGLLEKSGSKAKVSNKPKMDMALASVSVGKPKNPIAMPQDLVIEPAVRTAKPGATHAVAANPWAPIFAVAGQKQVVLYHSDTFETLGVLNFPEGTVNVLKFSRNGDLILAAGGIGGKSGKVVVWKVANGQRVIEVGNETDAVLAADISADQTKIALGGPAKLVKIYSTKDGELLNSIKKHTDWVQAIEFSPDAVLLASGDRSGNLHVWETNSGNEFYGLRGHTGPITDLAWRDDSNVLASASEDTTIRLWEMQNGGQIKSWGAHGGGVQSVRFAHDGRLVSCGRDRVVKLWDANGAQKLQFEGFGDLALKVAIAHDGNRVLAGDWSGEVRVWNTADGKRVGNLQLNPPTVAERLDAATKAVVALEAPAAKLLAEYQAAEAARTANSSDVAGLQAQAKSAVETVARVESQLGSLRQKELTAKAAFAQVESQLAEKAKQLATAEEAARKARIAADALAVEFAKSKKDFGEKQTVLAATQKELAPLTDAVGKSKAIANAAMQQAAQKAEAIKKATQLAADAKMKSDRAVAELASARRQVMTFKAAKVNVNLQAARNDLAGLEGKHRALVELADKEKAVAAKIAAEIDAVGKFVANGGKLIEAKQADVAKAKSAVEPTTKAVQAAEAVVAAKKQLHATMLQSVAAILQASQAAKDNKALAQSAAKAKEAADLLASDVDAANKVVAAKVADRQKADAGVKAALAAVEELKADLAAAPKRTEALKANVVVAQAQIAAATANAETFAKSQIAPARTRVENLANEYARAKAPSPANAGTMAQ